MEQGVDYHTEKMEKEEGASREEEKRA